MQPSSQILTLPALEHVIEHSPLTVAPDTSVLDAIALLNQIRGSSCELPSFNPTSNLDPTRQQPSCVLVVEGSQLAGIFTQKDVVRLIASGVELSEVKIAEVMTKPVITLKQSEAENIFSALSVCLQHQIHHVPVLNDLGQLVGIVTQTSLLQALDPVKIFGVIEALQRQLEERQIEQQSTELLQAYQQLQTTLEELQSAEEEMRSSNEKLATARQTAELESQRYQALFDFAPDGYLVTDAVGTIQEANRAAASLLSVRQDSLVGKPLVVFIAEPDRATFHNQLTNLQPVQDWELYLQPRRGTPFPASIRVAAVYDPQGKQVGWRWLCRDITKRKQAEEALRRANNELEILVAEKTAELVKSNVDLQQEIYIRRQAEEQLRFQANILSQVSDAVIAIDNEYCVTYWNQGAERQYGLKADEIIGRRLEESHQYRWLKAEDEQAAYDALAATGSWHGENIHVKKSGEEIYVESSVSVIKDNSGAAIGLLAVIRDIGDRKQAEEVLRQQTERERLVAEIAQNIRQSLNLDEILNTTVAQVRQFLQTDRVIILRFEPDWSGRVVTESVSPEWTAILSTNIYDPCFSVSYVEPFKQGLVTAKADIYNAGLDPCYIELLAQFQVRANLVVPILQGEQLWGLLVAHHCSAPRQWQQLEIDLLRQLAMQVALALQQSQLYSQTQHRVYREQALNRVIQSIRNSLDLTTIFFTAASEIANLLQAERAGIVQYLPQRKLWLNVADYRSSPDLPVALGLEIPDEGNEIAARLKRLEVVRIDKASTCEDTINRGFAQTFPGACLLIPLHFDRKVWGSLSLVRNSQPFSWQNWEVELTCAVADQLAIAIQQSELYEQAQTELALAPTGGGEAESTCAPAGSRGQTGSIGSGRCRPVDGNERSRCSRCPKP